jgi:hypothetical protein
MKKFIFFVLSSILFFSCSLENVSEGLYLDIVPVSNVEMPTAFRVDSITKIPMSYVKPTPCHVFSNFYYNSIGNERTVAIYCSKPNSAECIPTGNNNYTTTVELGFKPKSIGTYHFRFWAGVDASGTDQYIEHEVVVDH